MKESDILALIKEKGYEAERVYHINDHPDPPYHSVLVTKDWPKAAREPRRWFEAPTLTQLFNELQNSL